jgi:hypothetical protein
VRRHVEPAPLLPELPGLSDLREARNTATRLGLIVVLVLVLLGSSWAYATGKSLVAVLVIGGVLAVIARRHFGGDRMVYAVIALSVLGTLLLTDMSVGDRQVGDVMTAGLGHTAHLSELLLKGLKAVGNFLSEVAQQVRDQPSNPSGPSAIG